MVSLITDENELSFLPADPYSARITALAKTYGTDYSFAMFWVQKADGIPVAAIGRVDGNMTLCCLENADFEELSCFVEAVGYSSVTYDDKFSGKLGITPQKTSFTVRYSGGAEISDGVERDYDKKGIYSLLCECGFELGDYRSFLSDICSRLNKSTASFVVKTQSDKLCACAFALFEGEKSVLLGAVATSPDARGRGYARELVGTLAQSKSEKEVFLFCRNDSLWNFYKEIGFEMNGKWAVYEK